MAGPNSVGKTALWDAACIYAARGRYARLRHLPESREEYTAFIHEVNVRRSEPAWPRLFYAQRFVPNAPILTGPGTATPAAPGGRHRTSRPSFRPVPAPNPPSPAPARYPARHAVEAAPGAGCAVWAADRQRLAGELRLRERTAHRRRLLRRRGLGRIDPLPRYGPRRPLGASGSARMPKLLAAGRVPVGRCDAWVPQAGRRLACGLAPWALAMLGLSVTIRTPEASFGQPSQGETRARLAWPWLCDSSDLSLAL